MSILTSNKPTAYGDFSDSFRAYIFGGTKSENCESRQNPPNILTPAQYRDIRSSVSSSSILEPILQDLQPAKTDSIVNKRKQLVNGNVYALRNSSPGVRAPKIYSIQPLWQQ